MTVGELKEVLTKMDDNMPVYIEHPYGEDAYVYTFLLGARTEDKELVILYGE